MRLRLFVYFLLSYTTILICGTFGIKGITLLESAAIGLIISPLLAYIADTSVRSGEMSTPGMMISLPRIRSIRLVIVVMALSFLIIFGPAAILAKGSEQLVLVAGVLLFLLSSTSLCVLWLVYKDRFRDAGFVW